ncbi:PAS domain-containing protein [Mangrovimonas sp. AS39]|uniref:PAS domain-containing protein n=1 Tax=Mangrovimonas futianensis TaxID=2895523 RepID=UPI001E287378|nr:PAS domain-containing protein [Mangrovimonas futianensis]MCF1193026.1 PAS domain-containing protein [Mangrovimonas futianensis]MCF1196717.1 PAS domain-containing protein [Mangrovimonas futianensis]MCF1421504.1 PAS domain-containing protein [Mangrovimonas futianensis]
MLEGFLNIVYGLIASLLLMSVGFLYGRYKERKRQKGSPLENYPFYPFSLDDKNMLQFDLKLFNQAVSELKKHKNYQAGEQLILIGEQNNVRQILKHDELHAYNKLYKIYDGDKVLDDSVHFLENYKRIVRLIGDSFPDCGIEILLHNLSNPYKALYCIKNNVTGRNIEAPATNLVMDLKRRNSINEDKLNYELNIGSRKFKCTTIPIFKEKTGLVGAICINVDYNYLQKKVKKNPELIDQFLDTICKVNMVLDENILSKHEYELALNGKSHFRDF